MAKSLRSYKNVILVQDIPEDGLHMIFENMPDILSDIEEYKIQGLAKGEVFFRNINKDIHIRGKLAVSITLICDRCLEKYNQYIDTSLFYTLVPSESLEGKREIALTSEDMEISFYDGAEIQIGEIIREQILLQIPMRQVCKEDCKGICPLCGVDLNKEECLCQSEILNNPFSVLKKFKTK
jgi:uncharacterized protein